MSVIWACTIYRGKFLADDEADDEYYEYYEIE